MQRNHQVQGEEGERGTSLDRHFFFYKNAYPIEASTRVWLLIFGGVAIIKKIIVNSNSLNYTKII